MLDNTPTYSNVLSPTFARWRRTYSRVPRGHTHIVRDESSVTLCGKPCDGWMGNIGVRPDQASCLSCLRRYAALDNTRE